MESGHFTVKPTLEMVLVQSAVRLERRLNEEAGIPLLDIRPH